MISDQLESGHAEIDRVNDYADRTLQGDNTTREMVVPYQDRRGRRRIKGGRDLKNSQAYPKLSLRNQRQKLFVVFAPLRCLSTMHFQGSSLVWLGAIVHP